MFIQLNKSLNGEMKLHVMKLDATNLNKSHD